MAAINGKGMYGYDSVYFTTLTFKKKALFGLIVFTLLERGHVHR